MYEKSRVNWQSTCPQVAKAAEQCRDKGSRLKKHSLCSTVKPVLNATDKKGFRREIDQLGNEFPE